ncbi:hypothetical protein [Microbacterium sp. YY-01]|uniref:hypothetical protein n=1 Tax=Microbacterium sp. YY-01 TaxID=3421634 RepID=UPI003D1837BE
MDPFWAAVADLWWVAPATAGAAGLGVIGMYGTRSSRARRVGYAAAVSDLRLARSRAVAARMNIKTARADQARIAASSTHPGEIHAARTAVREAEQQRKTAVADVRAARARVQAERAAWAAPKGTTPLPVERVRSAHDAVIARWVEYETDPALSIGFPLMSDARHPATARFLQRVEEAQRLRPPSDENLMKPRDFSRYREAVAELARAFSVAEHSARGAISAPASGDSNEWHDTAQRLARQSADVIDKVTGFAAGAITAWSSRKNTRDE